MGVYPECEDTRLRALFGIDLRSLALFRVGLALLLLADLALRAGDLEAFYSDFGILPRAAHGPLVGVHENLWSLHLVTGSVAGQALLFALAAACATALLVGWRTRTFAILSWVLLVSLHTRNHLVNIGGDIVLRQLLLFSIFLPLGARFSLDRRRETGPGLTGSVLSVASAALLIQVVLLYPVGVLFKLREPPWQELTFLYQAMSIDGVATDLGRQLLRFPAWLPALSWIALQFEAWAWLLAFSPLKTGPLRTLTVALFVGFHVVGIGLTFHIGLFPLVMAVAWLAFLPAWFWERLGAHEPTQTPGARAREPAPRQRRLALTLNIVAAYLLACLLLHVVYTLDPEERRSWVPEPMWTTTWLLRQDQHWALWARPMTNRYSVFAATLEDGSQVDLHRDGAPLDWESPRPHSRNNHWWKYQLNLSKRGNLPHRRLYADFLARDWNRGAPPERQVRNLELWLLDRPWIWEPDAPLRRTRLWPQ
jgi:hypothetical protein